MYDSIDAAAVAAFKATGASVTGVHLDWSPAGAIPPYATYNGNNGTSPVMRGDGRALRYTRQIQFDYWTTKQGDSPDDLQKIREGLNGTRVYLVGGERIRFNFVSSIRVPEPKGDNLCHHTITVEVAHSPDAR